MSNLYVHCPVHPGSGCDILLFIPLLVADITHMRVADVTCMRVVDVTLMRVINVTLIRVVDETLMMDNLTLMRDVEVSHNWEKII